MKTVTTVFLELVLVAIAILLADSLQQHINFIPSFIVSLPQVDYSSEDLKITLSYFIIIHALTFYTLAFFQGRWKLDNASRTALELFGLAAAFTLSSLAQFLTSTANFDPNLMVGIAELSAVLFIMVYLVCAFIQKHAKSRITELLIAIVKRCFSVSGICILLLALTPAILAKAFVSNRDLANVITQWRMFFSGENTAEYHFANAFGTLYFSQPMIVKNPPNNENSYYVLERAGHLLKVNINPDTTNTTDTTNKQITIEAESEIVLDLTEKVGFIEMENGALGFAFHPKFGSDNHYLYLYYTDVRDGRQTNRVSRFDLSLPDATQRTNSEHALITLERETSGFHNGGSLDFGSDGFLYIAFGEGLRTPKIGGLNETLRMGILRIDVDQKGGDVSRPISRQPGNGTTQSYYIPLDNPFLDNLNALDEYWAIGLRNPFRASFDPLTNQLWVGDVGSTEWEEINIITPGSHYQYPFAEGFQATDKPKPDPLIGKEAPPVFAYYHSAAERAVIGGVVYRGNEFNKIAGQYIFADNYSGNLYQLDQDSKSINKKLIAQTGEYAQRGISSVTEMLNGDIFVTTLGRASAKTGQVLKLTDDAVNTDKKTQPDSQYSVTQQDIEEIYATNCARCHGSEGHGNGPDQEILKVKIADFSSGYFQNKTSKDIENIIRKGGPTSGLSPMMPPWENILSPAEIEGLSNYVKTIEKRK